MKLIYLITFIFLFEFTSSNTNIIIKESNSIDTIPGYEWLGNMPNIKMVIRQQPTYGPRQISIQGGRVTITGSDSTIDMYH